MKSNTSKPVKLTALARRLGVTKGFIYRFMIAKGFRLEGGRSTPEVATEWLRLRLV